MPDSPEEQKLSREAAEKAAAAARMAQQSTWVDLQIARAMRRGEFDNLPGAGKPIEGLGETHDPDWWVKKLVDREQIAILPPSLALRRENDELDDVLDTMTVESEVREHIEDFNERVIQARYSLPQGPPLTTMPRDVEATVAAWRERYAAFRAVPRIEPGAKTPRRHWWNRRNRR
ncbi:DUF1992 domain-containing protein [Nocardioides sp. SR21]|uniref:DnaJ family domain-containing protein n=1 Tax=Nocardioides sp. SR21 TaxID=2919501 RepID=UPI001FAA787E|nr:DUF1992 domain-containing protein [Nocardioides sp. SR21]